MALVGLALVFAVVWLVYRRRLPKRLGGRSIDERFRVHYPLMIKTSAVALASVRGR